MRRASLALVACSLALGCEGGGGVTMMQVRGDRSAVGSSVYFDSTLYTNLYPKVSDHPLQVVKGVGLWGDLQDGDTLVAAGDSIADGIDHMNPHASVGPVTVTAISKGGDTLTTRGVFRNYNSVIVSFKHRLLVVYGDWDSPNTQDPEEWSKR